MKIFSHIAQENFNVRNYIDRRKKENNLVISYLDKEGIEYRKKFSFPVNTTYDIMLSQIPKTIE